MQKIMERFEENTARVEKIVWLAAGVLSENSAEDILEDFFKDERSVKECFPEIYDHLLEAADDGDYYEIEMLLGDAEKFGFLFELATPCMTCNGTSLSYSWSSYYKGWVYGDTFDKAVEKGFAWVESRRAEDKSREQVDTLTIAAGEPHEPR